MAAATAASTHLFVEDAHLLVDNLDDADGGAGLAGALWRTANGHAQDGLGMVSGLLVHI